MLIGENQMKILKYQNWSGKSRPYIIQHVCIDSKNPELEDLKAAGASKQPLTRNTTNNISLGKFLTEKQNVFIL